MTSLPDLVLPKREFFGLSIDRTSLRAVQLDRSGKVTGLAEVTFPTDLFAQSVLTNPELLSQAIKKVREIGKFSTPYVVVSFPEAFAYTRELVIPLVAITEISEAVAWHVKDLFPFPEDDIYIDWKITRTSPKDYTLTVVAVQKKTIDPIVETLLTAGLKPLRLKPDASTIASLLGLPSDKHALVTEVNKGVAYVTLVEGEKPVFTTVVPFTPDDTAATYLINVKKTIDEITTYYRKKEVIKKEEAIEIILTGEVANDQWVHELHVPSKILSTPLKNSSFNKAYATALPQMLAIGEAETINLLPAHMQKFYDKERNILYYNTILFRACSFIGAYCVFVAFVLVFVVMERQQLDAQVKQLTTLNQAQEGSSHNLLVINGTAKQIVALAPLRQTPKDSLAAFLALVPASISISQWDYEDDKLQFTISGVSETREDLLNFKSDLENSQKFTNISLPLTFLESSTNIPFSMTFVVK